MSPWPSSHAWREAVLAEDVPGLAGGACGGAAVGGESGCQVPQRPPGRVGGGEQARGVGEALAGGGEHAEQLDAVAGAHPVAAAVPLHGGLADQVLGVGELAPVPGHDALGVAQRGGGDRLAAAAELGARLADGGGRRGLVTGDGGQARQVGQGGGNEHDDPDAAPAVGGPAQRADGGRGIAPGGGEAGLGIAGRGIPPAGRRRFVPRPSTTRPPFRPLRAGPGWRTAPPASGA